MAKSKHSAKWRIAVVKKCLCGEGSYATLAKEQDRGRFSVFFIRKP